MWYVQKWLLIINLMIWKMDKSFIFFTIHELANRTAPAGPQAPFPSGVVFRFSRLSLKWIGLFFTDYLSSFLLSDASNLPLTDGDAVRVMTEDTVRYCGVA